MGKDTTDDEATTPVISHITLLGKQHAIQLPPDFATRDEILAAWIPAAQKQKNAIHRVNAALLGVCTRIGRYAAKDKVKTYEECECDPFVYGGLVYTWLMRKGATLSEMNEAAIVLVKQINASRAPTEDEVAAKADFSAPPEA